MSEASYVTLEQIRKICEILNVTSDSVASLTFTPLEVRIERYVKVDARRVSDRRHIEIRPVSYIAKEGAE